jgi:hypothetical protein
MVLGKDCDAYPSLTKYSWSQFKKYSRYHFSMVADPFSLYTGTDPGYYFQEFGVRILRLGIRIFMKKILKYLLFFFQQFCLVPVLEEGEEGAYCRKNAQLIRERRSRKSRKRRRIGRAEGVGKEAHYNTYDEI